MNKSENVNNLYIKKDTLSTRINLHAKYSVNKYGWNKWVFEQYNINKNNKIIEFGCGNGSIWVGKGEKLPENVSIILTDISPLMIEKTKENITNKIFSIELMDIQNIPFSDNYFDIIIANHMLYHVPNIDKALFEIRRTLKEGGLFYSTTVGKEHLIELETIYKKYQDKVKFSYSGDLSFRLDNGKELLQNYFNEIDIKYYIDFLEVTNSQDLLDYINSYNEIPDNINQEIYEIINKEIDKNGIKKINKESGIFICKK
jgi:ubiquinone/menaquinone biosynthesis C-methylase UbiE